ncbi:glycosyltransferase family 4 protein [Thalassobaculum sp. OXR-137]|uniref:glycosyltransferase family 4 protein n=1 Tax=Thalassobaculum sp. OXR-137 TaxID=3100173 RepID=UPI002AC95CC6|nr:glycosyltransferase family 4 protein [Thalassobaculum sp. OXR-137]WPZ33648.1 glycosyltransferase family 4 protein [Thalassobaculum sp. OXR-137]
MAGPDVHFLIPGDPATPTGGFVYARHAVQGLREAGLLAGILRIDGPFPQGDAAARSAAQTALTAVPDGDRVVVDGLAYTALAPVIAPHAQRLRIIALVHHPLGDETGFTEEERDRWLRDEIEALALARHILVPSRTTRARLGALGLDTDRVTVVVPGVDPAPDLAFRAKRAPGPLRLLCVATLIPRKAQHLLLEALAPLADRDWHLTLVGDARDPAYADRLRKWIEDGPLAGRVTLAGAVDDAALDAQWRAADAFVFPSLHEGWGIAPVEAVRWGLPVVTSDAGALPESVPEPARVMVPAGDVAALGASLARLMDDPAHRRTLAHGARQAAAGLTTWADMRSAFAQAMTRLP